MNGDIKNQNTFQSQTPFSKVRVGQWFIHDKMEWRKTSASEASGAGCYALFMPHVIVEVTKREKELPKNIVYANIRHKGKL